MHSYLADLLRDKLEDIKSMMLSADSNGIKATLAKLGGQLRYYKKYRALRYQNLVKFGKEFMENSLAVHGGRSVIEAKVFKEDPMFKELFGRGRVHWVEPEKTIQAQMLRTKQRDPGTYLVV